MKDGTKEKPRCFECRTSEMKAEFEKREEERIREKAERLNAEQREHWHLLADIPQMFETKTFADFDRKLQPKAFDAVKAMLDRKSRHSLVLYSPNLYGVGKTHLVAALGNELLATIEPVIIDNGIRYRLLPFMYLNEPAFLIRLRKSFKQDSESYETEADIYESVQNPEILVIDDVGKIRPKDSSFLQSVWYQVIDNHYTHQRHIILTTNLTLAELEAHIGGACADRLREMCGKGGFIQLVGKSHRH